MTAVPDFSSPPASAPYPIGERLSYNVSFSNFPTAAHVELLVAARGAFFGREGVELRAHVETIGIVSAALYSLNNDYLTYVDPATGLPFRTQQLIREGVRTADVSRSYNQPIGAVALPDKQTAGGFPGTYDFLSALYYLRTLPLAPGAVYPIAVHNNGSEYQAEVTVLGRELLKTNVGSSNAIITQVRVRNDKPANKYRLRIYFTDDESHVPVLITAQHPAGEIRIEIASTDVLSAEELALLTAGSSASPVPPVVSPETSADPGAARNPGAARGADSSARGTRPPLPFAVGEELNFNFFLGDGAQLAGKASFKVRPRATYFNQDGLLLTTSIQSAGSVQRLFPVSDQINSYVDALTLLPFRTELNLQEGRRRANWTISIKQDLGTAIFNDGTRLEIPVGTHDLVSVFYALRSFDLIPPKRNAVSLLINKRPRLLIVTALQRQVIELGGQRIPALQLSLVTDGPQGDKLNLRLWVSTDSRRLPLRLTATTPLGPVRADLAIIPVTFQ